MAKKIFFAALAALGLGSASALDVQIYHSLDTIEDKIPASSKVDFLMAGNEYESAQIRLTSSEAARVSFQLPESPDFDFQLRKMMLVSGKTVSANPDPAKKTDETLDALLPLETGDELSLKADEVCTILFTAKSRLNAAPGKYSFELKFSDEMETVTVPIQLEVVNFQIPVTPSFPFVSAVFTEGTENHYHCLWNSDAGKVAMQQWYDAALEYRISPYFWRLVWVDETLTYNYCFPSLWPVDDPRTMQQLSDPRLAAFAVPFRNPDDREETDLRKLYPIILENNWQDRCYSYLFDEPRKPAYDTVHQAAAQLKEIAPEVRPLVTYFCGPDGEGPSINKMYDELGESCQIHSMSYWAVGDNQNFINELRNQDRKPDVWPYVCMGPGEPAPNYFIRQHGFQHRFVTWRAWKENANGFLYWAINATAKYPLGEEPVFRSDIPAGDGLLFYPAEAFTDKRAETGFLPPIASIRAERLRDSMEDIELFEAFSAKFGRDQMVALLNEIYPHPYQFPASSEVVENFRRNLLRKLAE